MEQDSWLDIPDDSHFSLANIPFGISSLSPSGERHASVAVGKHVLDLHHFAIHGGFEPLGDLCATLIPTFSQPALNDFAALGQEVHARVRKYMQTVFAKDTSCPKVLRDNTKARQASLHLIKDVTMHLPMHIAGYTDFFAGKNHAYNCGCIFRDPAKALQPNYLHLPVGYNSRASTVVVSGTPIRRPLGQFLDKPGATEPSFGPCRRLDIELELGALLCKGNDMGEAINVNKAGEHIFGYVLLNDWSARDIQAWEAVPLGPFNAKTFGTTISPWVVLKSALEPFAVAGIENEAVLCKYLRETDKDTVFDIDLEVVLTAASGESAVLTRTNASNLVFSFQQMLAHHTIGGCSMEVGDLLGSGTISGTEPGSLGSLLEQSKGGKQPIVLSENLSRTFLEDGDTVTIRGWCQKDGRGRRVGFGLCVGAIMSAPVL
ncbi:hypothetical protein ANO11243_061770 [Dothideomycetidae sp. 11243]|nr:hypothetical protein ANO11243_061770 [fungal sp. No.11243]